MNKPAENPSKTAERPLEPAGDNRQKTDPSEALPKEIGGRDGPEPTRFGDWEKNGRCIDF